ncbi:dynein heavy chain, putative [Plasmodium vivax]|uniref:Dynein heavy chain, putative n=1 Tax=Plasmodium vivax TaxID=5855 RepID=A0A565A2E6_PLAVI|nr:dynein heavy chain, putative [Plasmodium vivax]
MNDELECYIKQKITSLLRIRSDDFNCLIQEGKNKDDLNYFFLSAPVKSTLFFVVHRYTYEEEADERGEPNAPDDVTPPLQNDKEHDTENPSGDTPHGGKDKAEESEEAKEKITNHSHVEETDNAVKDKSEEGGNVQREEKRNDTNRGSTQIANIDGEKEPKREANGTKGEHESEIPNPSEEPINDKVETNLETSKGEEQTQSDNKPIDNSTDGANKEEEASPKGESPTEEKQNEKEKKTKIRYTLKMSLGHIEADDVEEEAAVTEASNFLPNTAEAKQKRKNQATKQIVYFLKINSAANDQGHENLDEYFNANYTFGNLHHNYINNLKAYFKIFFIPFFQCLLKKNDVFEYIGKETDQSVKIDQVLSKLQHLKKTELLTNQLDDTNELNENKYLNIMERGKHTEQLNEFGTEDKVADGVTKRKGANRSYPPTQDSIRGNGIHPGGTKKEENFLKNKNLLNSFYYLLSYYKQILKVEQISYNEINADMIKLKDDTININNYLRNISNILKDFIIKEKKNDSKRKNDKTAVEYWKERYHRIYSLIEKINSKKFEQIIENIKGKNYNGELCNEIKLLIKEVENMHMESFEMIKFSKILENSFETLKCSHINQMKNGIKLVIRKLKNIWLSSKYFRKDEIIIAFFVRLSDIIFEFILFLAIKVKKMNKPKRIKKVISKCIDILKFYEKEFIYVKLDIETIDIRKNWYFDKNVIFKNIRHLQHVLATLYTVYSEIIYFTDLCLLKLKKLVNNKQIMNSIILEINKLYEPFNDVLKNIYLYDDESIMQLMKKLNEQCLKIEKKCIKIIYIQFSNLRNTKSTYLLVEKFQNLKKSYKIDRLLIKKLYDILFLYKKELYLYIDLFNNMCANKDLDIYKKFLFCLNIYKKIKKPILIFKNNSYITTSNEYKIIVKLYVNFCKKMFSYIIETYVIWKNNSLSQMNKFLSSNLITINKQLNFFYVINFDSTFFKTLYEYAYIESMYDFNTPIEILNMYNLKKKLYRYLYELNEIIFFFKNFTSTTSIIQQKVLIKFFQCFEQKLIYISNNINWLNLNIDHYINDLKNCKSVIENVHVSLSYSLNSIDKIIYNMQNVNLVRYIEWGNMKPLHIQPFFNYFEEYRINQVNKILQKYKEISQILIKIEQIVEKTKKGRCEIMDELYYLYQCKIYKCLSLIIIKGLCNYETLIENDFQKKFLENYKPCLYIKEDIYSDVFLNNSIQNIFKLISKLLTNLLLTSSEFIRWLDYSCIEVPISLKEDFDFLKMKFSFYQSVSKNKIIIDRIIHIHQLIQNVFQKANKYIYSFMNYDNIINSIVRTQGSFNIHQNISYPLIYYDNILKNISNIQNKIDRENDKKTIQFISLNVSFVLNSIKNKLLDSKKFFFNNLHFIFTTLKCSTLSEITKYSGILETCTSSMDRYENIIKTINTIKAENINIEMNIQKTEEIYNMLTIYGDNTTKEEQKEKLLLLYPQYLSMLNSAFFNDNLMFTIKQEFYKNTKNKITVFEEKVKSILKKFHMFGPSSENIDLSEGMESLKKYINDFKTMEIEKEEIIKAQILCNMKIFQFENFYLLKNTIKIYNSIYSIYNSYTTRINDFLDVIYYKLNIKEINKSLKEVKSELTELQKDQPEAKNILPFKKINEELNKMNTTLIIVYLLQNTNMKLTNWQEIIDLHLKRNNIKDPVTFENTIIINDKNINIKSITLYDMYELKIYLYFNDIKYIIYKIKEVEKLEKHLNKIENNWKQETLKIIKCSDHFILDENKNIFKNIKKTFSDLHQMRNLNFAQDLIPKITHLQNKLLFIHELLSLWMLTQDKWARLEKFYNNENFNHFSNEMKNFNKINKTYVEIMKNAKKNLNLFHVCNTQFFYFLKNYYERVLFLTNETISLLQDKKFSFPDFFFLTDEELFCLLSNTETENLKKYCFVIYEELLSFNDIDKTIIEVVTTKNNTLNLKNGVKIIGIDTYVILKEKIKSTLKENIVASLKSYYNTTKIIPIIMNNVSVVSITVIKIILSEEMRNVLQQKSVEYTQGVLDRHKDLCNDIAEEIKKEKGKNTQKIEQALIIYLEFINTLKKIIQENLFDENNFFLYYQFRYSVDKNKEQIAVKYGNYTFKYNYDILENNSLFINMLPNNKYVFSICSNMHKSYYNILCGKNKASTIRYITSTLGQRTYFLDGKTHNIRNYILGSIQMGYALVFQNVDEMKVELLSVLTNAFRSIQTCLKKKEKNIYLFSKDVVFNSSSVIFFTSKSCGCRDVPINLRSLCRETTLNNCQQTELVEILLYVNNFQNVKNLCLKICNFVEYLNFIFFSSKNNVLNDIINIIRLCKKENEESNTDELLAKYIFIYYYDKLKDIKQNELHNLINKFLDVDLNVKYDLQDGRDRLKELLKQECIYLKEDLFHKYEKDVYVLKEKLQNQSLSLLFGRPHTGKSTLLKIYSKLCGDKYGFIYLDSLYDSQNHFNEAFLRQVIKKKLEKHEKYTLIMKLNFLSPIIYNVLSLDNLVYPKRGKVDGEDAENGVKIIIECKDISAMDPYLLNKMNKIAVKDNTNIYNYFKNKSSKLIDDILNTNFFFEKNAENDKTSLTYINNYEEKKKILLELYNELKSFYRNFFLPIFHYIERKKGNNFNIHNFYTKEEDVKNMTLGDAPVSRTCLFHTSVEEKIVINNFIDIFKSNILIFLRERELNQLLPTEDANIGSAHNDLSTPPQMVEPQEGIHSQVTELTEQNYEQYATNEEYDLDNINKNYIENVCILQAEAENNKKVELHSKKEISKISIIKEKALFILLSCLVFLFNNFLNDQEKSNFFIFLKQLASSNNVNIGGNLGSSFYHIQKDAWIPISDFFMSSPKNHLDEKFLIFYDEEMQKRLNSISLLYKGQSNICLIGSRKNCKSAILKEIVNSHSKIDHLMIDVLKHTNVLNFKVLYEKMTKKNVKKYFHHSVLYICIDDIHISYEKGNNPSIEFLHNLQRNLCYFENKALSVQNVKSMISLNFEHMKGNSYYESVSYSYASIFLNSGRKGLVGYFSALVNHTLKGAFQGVHSKLVNYSLDVFFKIHEDINFEEKKENHLLFTKENIFLLYEDFFYTKWNFQNEQDVVANWCESAERVILNRILKKENRKDILKTMRTMAEKHFQHLHWESSFTYLNYFCKEVHEKVDADSLKDEFVRSLSSYNNLYINTKMFVEFYFKNILQVYKNISKNINSSMIICMNKKRAIILLNAIAFILNINTVLINKSSNLENPQDKINYYNRLRFKRHLFILINHSYHFDDYFYSLIYKKFPSALFDKKELFHLYTKTNLISNELKWENIQTIMKKNTYVCLVHEKRFDLYSSNFQNYKNVYSDLNVVHLDSWSREEYTHYCHLFLKNHQENHFIDNILNNFKKKAILNTLEDDIEKEGKGITMQKREKTKGKNKANQIFINSEDYIKKNKNDNPKGSENEKGSEVVKENALPNEGEKQTGSGEDNTEDAQKGGKKEANRGTEKESGSEHAKADDEDGQVRDGHNGDNETGGDLPKTNDEKSERNPQGESNQEEEKPKDEMNKTDDIDKGVPEKKKKIKKGKKNNQSGNEKKSVVKKKEGEQSGKKINSRATNEKKPNLKNNEGKPTSASRVKGGILSLGPQTKARKEGDKPIKKGVAGKNASPPKGPISASASKQNGQKKERQPIGGAKTMRKENVPLKRVPKANAKKNGERDTHNVKGKPAHKKVSQKSSKKEMSQMDNAMPNKPMRENNECETGEDTKEGGSEKLTNDAARGVIANDKNDVQRDDEQGDQPKEGQRKEESHQSGKDTDGQENEKGPQKKEENEQDAHKTAEDETKHADEDSFPKGGNEEAAKNKDSNKKAMHEINNFNEEVNKHSFYNMIETQLENVVDVFIQVYYDLKSFLKKKNSNLNFIRINKYNFTDALIMFYILLKNKLNYKNKQLHMFKMGLKKVESIFENYNNMNEEIQSVHSSIKKIEEEIEHLNNSIKTHSKMLLDTEQQFNANKQVLNKVANDIDEMMENKNESEKQIEEECINIIFKIQNVEGSEIKNIVKIGTPDLTQMCIAIMINTLVRNSFLNDNNDNWNYFKNFISKENFSKFFFNFKKENITDKQIKRIKEYMARDEIVYGTKKILQTDNLFKHFFEWITFLIKYKEYYKTSCEMQEIISNNKLKKEQYENENEKLMEQMHQIKSTIINNKRDVHIQTEIVENLNQKLQIINKSYLPIFEVKQFLEKIQKKYIYTIEKIENNYKYIVSEVLLFSFFLNYSSPFNYTYRCYLLNKWKQIIKKNNILIREDIKIESIYSCDSIVSLFISDNFPRHIFYIQNALISLNHFRWPLLLDQQNIGIEWLKKSYSNNLVIHNFDENLSKHLDMCIIYGKSLIIPFFNFQNLYIYDRKNDEGFNCEERHEDNFKRVRMDLLAKKNFLKFRLNRREIKLNSNYAILEPVIERNVYLANGKYYINIGKKKLEYNSQFRLFLVSDSCDRYFQDVEDYVNIIDFQIDKNLIVNKIVNIILKHEDEKKVINFNTKIRNFYETKQTLKFLDDGMIIELCTFNHKANNNKNLMNVINSNVLKKMEIKKMLKEYKQEINKIKNSSENIKLLGYRFHTIYKVLQKQSRAKWTYSFNFNYLLNILNNLIKHINKKMLICNFNQLIKKFTHNCFVFLLNTIHKKDHLFFSFLFYSSLIFEEKKLHHIGRSIKVEKEKYFSLFLQVQKIAHMDTPDSLSLKIEWLNEKKKRQLQFLHNESPNFKALIQDMKNNSMEYLNWYKQKRPEDNLFFLSKSQLEKLENLELILFLYIMRKDRLYYYIHFLLSNYLDLSENMNSATHLNLSKDLNYIDAKTFMYITEPNSYYDPVLLKHRGTKTISVGNNFNSEIQIVIETSLQNGNKLLLENFHLINFNIEKFYEIYNNKKIHSNFEMYLTSEKGETSISIMKKAIKIYSQKNEYLKNFLTDLFSYVHHRYKGRLKNNFVNSFLFSLSFFHSILASRCIYHNYGFDEPYYFDVKDFENTFDCLLAYFDFVQINAALPGGSNSSAPTANHLSEKHTHEEVLIQEVNINWAFVKEIILNGYGNKVNANDRKIIKSYVKEYFNEYSFNEKNEFVYSADENFDYKFVMNRSIKEYVNLVKSYPLFNSCKTYGMKIEADKKQHEQYNENMLKNLEKICSEEVLVYKKENNDGDIFFNLDSDYYSSSLLNTDDEQSGKSPRGDKPTGCASERIEKNTCEGSNGGDTNDALQVDHATEQGGDPTITYTNDERNDNKNADAHDDTYDDVWDDAKFFAKTYRWSPVEEEALGRRNAENMDFLKNIKKMNEFYELIKKLKWTFKYNISIKAEWAKGNITTIQSCCEKETEKFKRVTNLIYNDVIKIEQELNKNKKKIDKETKLIMISLSRNEVPTKWMSNFNKKIKTIDSFVTYYENVKEQLYFWNITGELRFYNVQYLFDPLNFFKALLIKFSSVHKKKLDDCIFLSCINNTLEMKRKQTPPHFQKNFFYSSDEEEAFSSNQMNYSDYVHYEVDSCCNVDVSGLHTLNNNFECLGVKSRSNKKYDEIPIVTLSVIERREKNILKDKKIPLYQYKYNSKWNKKNKKFITNLYFKSDKHKSFIYINKVYLFVYN